MATKLDTVVSVILDSSGMTVGVKNANGQIRNLQGQFMKLKEDMQLVEKGTERFATAMAQQTQKANSSIKDSTNQMTSFKGVLESMFKPITALNQAFGVVQQSLYIVQRAFALTVGSATELELQVARITTVLDDAEVGQVNFAKRILEMQRVFGANPTEAAKGFYEAIASGATNAAGSIDLMATAQKLAVGGLLPLDKALSGLTSVMASYGYEANQTRYISDGFFIAAAKGKTNVEELTMEIGNVASIAQQANVSFEELVSAVSAVTLGGKRTAEATTSVRSAINALLTPTEQLQYVYDQLGISSITASIKQRGLQAVYEDIYKYTNYNVEALSKLVGRIEAVPAVVALTSGKQKAAYNDMLGSITDNTRQMGDVTERAFNIIAQTSAHRMEVAKGAISASLTSISQAFMVVLTPIIEVGAKILSAILTPIEATSAAFVTFSKSTNEYVIPALVALGATFVAMKIPVITASFSSLAAALTAVSTASLLVAGKFALIAAAVVAVTAVVDLFIKNIELIPEIFVFVMANIIKYSAKVIEVFQKLKESLGFETNLDQTRIDIKNLESASMNAAKNIKNNFNGGMFKGAIDGVKAFMDVFSDASSKTSAMGGAAPSVKPPTETKQGKAPDIAAGVEASKKALEQYNSLVQRTGSLEQQNNMAHLRGADLIIAQGKAQLENVKNIEKQLKITKQLTPERKKEIQAAKEAIDNATQIELGKEPISQYEDLIKKSKELAEQNNMANLEGVELINAQVQAELENIKNLEKKLALTKQLTPERKKEIEAAKGEIEKSGKIKIDAQSRKEFEDTVNSATGVINSAMGGADAAVGSIINTIGKSFGPEGQMVAAVINLLRMGGDFMRNLGSEIIKIIIELPLKLSEGLVGLVEGLLQGVIDMLADPAKLAKIMTTLQTIVPKIITAIAKAIPSLLKLLLDPGFWIEFASQLVRSIWDALVEMFYAVGDMLASIFSGDVFEGPDKAVKEMGTTVNSGIKYATDALTGVSDQMFAVMEDVPTQKSGRNATTVDASPISREMKKANKETSVVWRWIEKNIIKPLKQAGQWIGSGIEKAWKFAERVIGAVLQPVAAMIGKSIETAMNFVKLTFNLVANVLKTTWKVIITSLKAVWDIIIIAWKTSIEYLKAVWNGLMDVLKAVWDGIVSVFSAVFEYIKAGFEGLWNIIKTIFEVIWEAGKAAFNIIKAIFEGIWEYAKSVFDVIVQVFKSMWDGAKAIFDVIIVAFEAVWDVVKAIFDPIITAFKGIWDFVKSVFDIVISAFDAMWNFVKTLFDNPIKAFKELWEAVKTIFANVIEAFKGIWETIKNIFNKIIDAFKVVWESIKKIFDAIISALGVVWDGAKKIFDTIVDTFKAAWDGAKKIFDTIVDAFKAVWEGAKKIFSSIGEALSKSWDKLTEIGSSLWEGMKNIGSKVIGMFSDAGSKIWDGIKAGWDTISNTFSKLGETIWDGIKSAFDNIKNFFSNLFKFDGGGTGAVEKFLGFDFPWFAFAEGGKVPGTPKVMGDSAKNDTVAALLSPGEFVIPRSKMQDPNNLFLIDAIMSGGKAADWVSKSLLSGGAEAKASGGAIGNSSYGKWLSKAQSGGIEFHFSASDLDPFNKDGALRKGLAELDPTNSNSMVGAVVEGIWRGVKQAGRFVGDLFVPDWIEKIWDSVAKYLEKLNLKELIKNPWKAIKSALKAILEGANFLTEPFKKMMSFDNKGKGNAAPKNEFGSNNPDFAKDIGEETIQDQINSAIQLALKAAREQAKNDPIAQAIANQQRYFNSGGLVPGYGFKDTVPAMLTPGEFVINRNAVSSLGAPLLNQLNAGMAPSVSQAPVFNINLNIETKDAIDETFIRQKLIPTIKQEIRSSSLRGEFIVSAKGVKK